MSHWLGFRLFGPLASWGAPAVGEQRPTDDRPSKSAVLGLVGAALGQTREDEPAQGALASLVLATRVWDLGGLLIDYQTAQWPEAWKRKSWRKMRKWKARNRVQSRRGELATVERHQLTTTQSWRGYRTDFMAVVALGGPTAELETIRDALLRPIFVLSLGRKSCPPALPMAPRLIEAANPVAAINDYLRSPRESELLASLGVTVGGGARDYWEAVYPDLEPLATETRRDNPVSRRRWLFSAREEHSALAPEASDVS